MKPTPHLGMICLWTTLFWNHALVNFLSISLIDPGPNIWVYSGWSLRCQMAMNTPDLAPTLPSARLLLKNSVLLQVDASHLLLLRHQVMDGFSSWSSVLLQTVIPAAPTITIWGASANYSTRKTGCRTHLSYYSMAKHGKPDPTSIDIEEDWDALYVHNGNTTDNKFAC